jgi:hypothetical protein
MGRNGYAAFLRHIGPRPSPEHSLDRIDNARGYEPGNVRWATIYQQARNTRWNRVLEFRGERRCVAEWAEILGLRATTIYDRLYAGWSVEAALTTAPRHW